MRDIDDEIAQVYALLTSTTIKPKEVDVQTSLPADPMGDRIAQIIEYQEQLEEYKKELCEKKTIALITMKKLQVEDQRILLLRYFKDLTVEKVAEEMELSYKWAWNKLHEAEEHFCLYYQGDERWEEKD